MSLPKTIELFVLPRQASLDHLAALRAWILLRRDAIVVKPVGLADNAWQQVRRASWFRPLPLQQIPWHRVTTAHLLGFTNVADQPKLMDYLLQHVPKTIYYGTRPLRFPFAARQQPLVSYSLTAHVLAQRAFPWEQVTLEDATLLAMGITERTWSTLSSKTQTTDQQALARLREFDLPLRHIANQIILGLREGQRGLLQDLFRNMEDLYIGGWPITLTISRSFGHVQDINPILDILWSRHEPISLIIAVCDGAATRVWIRSRHSFIRLAESLQEFTPKPFFQWHHFALPTGAPGQARLLLVEALHRHLPGDRTVRDVMTAAPQCVPWTGKVSAVHDLMLRFNQMALVVTREQRYAGVITRSDLDRAIQMELWDAEIGPFVPVGYPAVPPDTPLRVLRSLMVRHSVTVVPVVETRTEAVLGIVPVQAVLRALDDPLPPPRDYAPLVEALNLPDAKTIKQRLQAVVPLRVLLLLGRIGERARAAGLPAYAVGGFVRDFLLNKANFDIDIVIIGNAREFASKLALEFTADLRLFERFHTARLTLDGLKIDFSSARVEHYAEPGALPHVEFSGLSNDLFRRDFTINALAIDLWPERFLHFQDFFGGYRDLLEGQLRILHPFSFLEDPTRMFRALRFTQRFGLTMSIDTQRAFTLARQRDVIATLSLPRLGSEIRRCFTEKLPYRVIAELFSADLLHYLHPDLREMQQLPARFKLLPGIIKRFHGYLPGFDQEALYWICLLSPLAPQEAETLLHGMGCPAERRNIVVEALEAAAVVPTALAACAEDDELGLHRILNRLSMETLAALAAFVLTKEATRKLFRYLLKIRPIQCQITGRDLIALGLKPGPLFRAIFAAILQEKIQGRLARKEDELNYAKRISTNLRF